MHSLESLARHISAELYPQETLVVTLRTWLATVDPAAYAQEVPWPPAVLAAYDEYKRLAAEHGTAHTAFRVYLNETRRNATPEQHLERARLAVAWGEAAVRFVILMLSFHRDCHLSRSLSDAVPNMAKCLFLSSVAEGRLSFIDNYRYAFSSTNSVRTHIDTGGTAITSGRNAVEEARRNYEGMNNPIFRSV